MTLTFEDDLDIQKIYMHTKNKVSTSKLYKVKSMSGTDRQTNTGRCDRTHRNAAFAVKAKHSSPLCRKSAGPRSLIDAPLS